MSEINAKCSHICQSCGAVIEDGMRFCSRCGTLSTMPPRVCVNCSSTVAPGMHFCHQCGALVVEKNEDTNVLDSLQKTTGEVVDKLGSLFDSIKNKFWR